jgi:hypothetical protein
MWKFEERGGGVVEGVWVVLRYFNRVLWWFVNGLLLVLFCI